MCAADTVRVSGEAFGGAADALQVAGAALDYLNSPGRRRPGREHLR
jgi:hypothetical protein